MCINQSGCCCIHVFVVLSSSFFHLSVITLLKVDLNKPYGQGCIFYAFWFSNILCSFVFHLFLTINELMRIMVIIQ